MNHRSLCVSKKYLEVKDISYLVFNFVVYIIRQGQSIAFALLLVQPITRAKELVSYNVMDHFLFDKLTDFLDHESSVKIRQQSP